MYEHAMTSDRQSGLTPEARAAKNKYMREWRKRNPEKDRATKQRYWSKKAKEMGIEPCKP